MAEERLLLFLENIGTIFPTATPRPEIQFTFTSYATRFGGIRLCSRLPNWGEVEMSGKSYAADLAYLQ